MLNLGVVVLLFRETYASLVLLLQLGISFGHAFLTFWSLKKRSRVQDSIQIGSNVALILCLLIHGGVVITLNLFWSEAGTTLGLITVIASFLLVFAEACQIILIMNQGYRSLK